MHPDLTSADQIADFRRRDLVAVAARARLADRLPAAAGRALVRVGERLQGLPAPLGVAPVLSGE